jgi:GNAT superfamily N-acetyltransferase
VVGVLVERIDGERQDWSAFCCGDPAIDGWLRQDSVAADRQVGVMVQVASVGGRVVGCYRLGSLQVQSAPSVTQSGVWNSGRVPVSAVLVSRLGVDQGWQRCGLGASLMWHALRVATAVASGAGARLVVARRETESAHGFLDGFGFRAFNSDPQWAYLPMRDVEVSISTPAELTEKVTVPDPPSPTG